MIPSIIQPYNYREVRRDASQYPNSINREYISRAVHIACLHCFIKLTTLESTSSMLYL